MQVKVLFIGNLLVEVLIKHFYQIILADLSWLFFEKGLEMVMTSVFYSPSGIFFIVLKLGFKKVSFNEKNSFKKIYKHFTDS